jgi:1-acyl-sn-glycerol-3-phosphate acyltransferase
MSVPGLVPARAIGLIATPGRTLCAVSRFGRRLGRVSMLAWNAAHGRTPRDGDDVIDTRRAAWRLSRLAQRMCEAHGVQIHVEGQLPRGPVVLVANHVSYFDPMVLLALVPACPIAKRELGAWPLVGPALREMGVTLVRRGDSYDGAKALRRALHALGGGTNVLVFPEGTTSRGERVLPLRRGIFGIARRLGVPVVPIAMRYDAPSLAWVGDEWFLPHYARSLGRAVLTVRVRVGTPIWGSESAADLARVVRGRLQDALRDVEGHDDSSFASRVLVATT